MNRLFRFALIAIMISAVIAFVSPVEETAHAQNAITCEGDLVIVGGPYTNPYATNLYWIGGDGPGLPTPKVMVGTSLYITWTVKGPGTWSNLVMYWQRGAGGGVSSYAFHAGCAEVVPGCDSGIYLPDTAVGGTITDNAAVFAFPDPTQITGTVLEVGKTFWMDGLDSTGMYRQVLVSCEWVWVEAAKTGPNYDEVWNGHPLPSHTVN
ncbi:MAG: hypothetical protein JXA10_14845 [Anaerolineae bacterium]|nr:hypothetical protein [Anaerolineae bacterium]